MVSSHWPLTTTSLINIKLPVQPGKYWCQLRNAIGRIVIAIRQPVLKNSNKNQINDTTQYPRQDIKSGTMSTIHIADKLDSWTSKNKCGQGNKPSCAHIQIDKPPDKQVTKPKAKGNYSQAIYVVQEKCNHFLTSHGLEFQLSIIVVA